MAPFAVGREQDPRLLEALPDRRDHVAHVALAVGRLDLATGEDVHAAGEGGSSCAAEHEDLDAVVGVASNITVAAGLAGIVASVASARSIAGDRNAHA